MAVGRATIRRRLREILRGGLDRGDLLVLLLGYADGLTDEEVSQVLGSTTAADVAAQHKRAIAAIRSRLKNEGLLKNAYQ